jgi:hypothetical protein
MDFEVLGFRVGPLRATQVHGHWTVRPCWGLLGGAVSAIPRSNDWWRARMLTVVAAGPLATLLAGIAAANLFYTSLPFSWLQSFLAALTQCSLLLFVLGLIPNRPDAKARNDARLFLLLCRRSTEADELLLFHMATQLQLAGVRPRDYPAELMGQLSLANHPASAMAFYAPAVVNWALDRKENALADAFDARVLDAVLRSPDRSLLNVALARSAFLDVLVRKDCHAALEKFSRVEIEKAGPEWLIHRLLAAYWLANGNVPECLAEICRARYAFPKRLPYFEFECMLLSQLHQRAMAYKVPDLFAQSRTTVA